MGLREGILRTRERLTGGLARLVRGRPTLGGDLLEEIETLLLSADVGVEATHRIVANLEKRVTRKQLNDIERLYGALKDEMVSLLEPVSRPLVLPQDRRGPFVILMAGVNGTGKTTTIGKMARGFVAEGRSVALAAADTFRAAAVAQLQVWGERNQVPVTAHRGGADPAAVVFEALETAKARGTNVLIVDTAGRLHTQTNLMEQLKKIRRVIGKLDPSAPHETMLVIDATTGQNAVVQALQFQEAVNVTGITLTKLDGTAKGGIIFALAARLGTPVRYIGIGEEVEDLRVFDAASFADALLDQDPL